MAKKAAIPAILDVPVSYGNFSAGDKVCRIGCTVPRANLPIGKADKYLCDCRVTGSLFRQLPNEQPDQGKLAGMDEDPINATFDVKGFRVNADSIAFGMTFMKKSVDKDALMELAQMAGRLVVTGVEDIESGDDADDEEGEDEKPSDDDFEE